MTEIRALIFDMDGVIVNSNPLHVEAWKVYNSRFGIGMDEAMQQRMFGKRNDELVRAFFGDHLTPDEVFAHGAAKEALYREMTGDRLEQMLVPGIREFLQLHAARPKGVGTNAEPPNVNFVLDGAQLRPYFRAVVDGHQVEHAKPHPGIYLKVAALLGVDPAHCVVFEDSHSGVKAALTAGMTVVGLSTTHAEMPGVSLLVPDFQDPRLATWLGERLSAV